MPWMSSQVVRARLARVAVVALFGAMGCAAPSAATPEPTSSANEIAAGALVAGRYTNSDFAPRIEVEVPAGWLTYHLSSDFFDVAAETEDGPA
jgi:hypothetical protein